MNGLRTRLSSAVLAIDQLRDVEAYASRLAFLFKTLLALHLLTSLAVQIGSIGIVLAGLFGAWLLVRSLAQLLTRVPSCTLQLTFGPRTSRAEPTPLPSRAPRTAPRRKLTSPK